MNEFQKSHVKNILNVLYTDCLSAGGDGDAFWYITYYDLNEIFDIVKEFNSTLKYPYETVELRDNEIHWGQQQEWILITNKKELYDNRPEWLQLVLVT